MQKLKPVMPSLREKKRYLTFEVLSDAKLDVTHVAKAVTHAVLEFVGELGMAQMGVIVLTDLYNRVRQRGVVRVSHVGVDRLKASLAFIHSIDGHPVAVKSVAVSGNIIKAKKAIA
ncbi:MAG TPA: Rpp14/Pop5 family protein [Candidatus Binatia bacterium]|nr:Rpp14/Pop5 family protein [Candidatus Binatia bacterium]